MRPSHRLLTLAALLAAAAAAASGQWVVETNSLRIVEPASAAGRHDAAIGDFGVPLYGATLSGEVQYVGGDAEGCTPFSERVRPSTPGFPVVLLVDRGDCYFIEKAYNAEKAGAQAVIVADFKDEKLLTMAAPEDRPEISKLKEEITIPTALVTRSVGEALKKALKSRDRVVVELDWSDSVAHPDSRVEWELWASPADGCGPACDRQAAFLKTMAARASALEAGGYTKFTPRYIMHRCGGSPAEDVCARSCIHKGRYCAFASPSAAAGDGGHAIPGRALVTEAKRRLCAAEVARKADKPEAWWAYAADAATSCTLAAKKFNDAQCARAALTGAGIDAAKVEACVGDVDADVAPDVLEENYDAQGVDAFGSSKILIVPTVVINGAQYRGRLDVGSVTRGLCAGFSEVTEPPACLTADMEVDECASGKHTCWTKGSEWSACVDTFRGYKCQCPFGFRGDGTHCEDIDECAEKTALCDQICTNTEGGYTCSCRDGFRLYGGASGPGACFPVDRCAAGNGGCEEGCTSSDGVASCQCRDGLRLGPDGKKCVDVDECKEGSAGCAGGCDNRDPRTDGVPYVCTCPPGRAVDPLAPKRCIDAATLASRLGVDAAGVGRGLSVGGFIGVAAAAAAVAVVAGAAVHSWRVKRETAAEVAAILRQYMPLDGDDLASTGMAGVAAAAAARAAPPDAAA